MNAQFSQARVQGASSQTTALPFIQPKRRLRLQLYAAIAVLDAVSLCIGFAIGSFARFHDPVSVESITLLAMVAPIFFGLSINSRAYSYEVLSSWRRGIAPIFVALIAAPVAILFIAFCLKAQVDTSRAMFAIAIASSAFLLVGLRACFHHSVVRVLNGTPISIVLIRDGVDWPRPAGLQVVDAEALGLLPDASDPLMLDRVGCFLKNADRVVISCPPERRAAWAMVLKGANIRGEILDREIADLGGLGVGSFQSEATMIVSTGPLAARSRAMKRLFDLSLALAACVALGPLMLLVAIAIKLESAGPVFFVQQRLGRGNRLFEIYKFRSMRTDQADAHGNRSAMRDDDRITRVGRFIRATSIDELPQILNVLRGEMSLVGPRPHALGSLAGDQLFWEVDQRYWLRHACKPGLTGLAQVRGFRGATHVQSDLVNRLQADLEYVNGWTWWRDLSILFATLKVLVHKNAF